MKLNPGSQGELVPGPYSTSLGMNPQIRRFSSVISHRVCTDYLPIRSQTFQFYSFILETEKQTKGRKNALVNLSIHQTLTLAGGELGVSWGPAGGWAGPGARIEVQVFSVRGRDTMTKPSLLPPRIRSDRKLESAAAAGLQLGYLRVGYRRLKYQSSLIPFS